MTSATGQEEEDQQGGDGHNYKKRDVKDDNDDEHGWVQATDWDDPLQTAILYKSIHDNDNDKDSTSCGHAIRWNPNVLVALKKCPICQESVSMICDGIVVANSKNDKNDDNNNNNNNNNRIMTCKFGKQVYRIAVVESKDAKEGASSATNKSSSSSSTWSLFSNSSSSSPETKPTKTASTAQDRVRQALGLVEGYRILYKGKVVYPSSSTNSTDETTVSNQLLDLAAIEWNKGKKKFMVVMGTQTGKELADKPATSSAGNNSSLSSLLSWPHILWLPLRIVQWGLGGAFWFAVSFFKPFLPQAYLPSSSNEDGRDVHDHQD